MLNGLDLFSGIGGISLALREYVRTIAYCEIDPYCQGVLFSRMASNDLCMAPVWDNVSTLQGEQFSGIVDIIFGGFPCQDISVAGKGKGLEGERSGLFFEIVRLAKEIRPKYIFLENVSAITSRGGIEVCEEVTKMGYDCRWCVISAASVGALHRRERWFLLAHSKHYGSYGSQERRGIEETIHDDQKKQDIPKQSKGSDQSGMLAMQSFSDSSGMRCEQGSGERIQSEGSSSQHEKSRDNSSEVFDFWKDTEPPICGVANGLPFRVDQIRALGNLVCPQQVKEAFEILMGIKR